LSNRSDENVAIPSPVHWLGRPQSFVSHGHLARSAVISTKLGKSHLDFSALWIHDFDVSKRVEGDGFNFSASSKF
jgi:hypothetical protein